MTKLIKIVFFILALQLVFFLSLDFLHTWPNRAATKDLVYERFATLWWRRPKMAITELIYTTNLLDFFTPDAKQLFLNKKQELVLTNNSDRWLSYITEKIPITCPQRLVLNLETKGDVGSVTFNGQFGHGKTPSDWWKGQVYLRVDQAQGVSNITILNGQKELKSKAIYPPFSGHQIELIFTDRQAQTVAIYGANILTPEVVYVNTDAYLNLPQGVFPQQEYSLTIQASPHTTTIVKKLDRIVSQDCDDRLVQPQKYGLFNLAFL